MTKRLPQPFVLRVNKQVWQTIETDVTVLNNYVYRAKCDDCIHNRYEEKCNCSKIWYLCENHVIVDRGFFLNDYYVETTQGRVQLNLLMQNVNNTCDKCTVKQRMCLHKDGYGRDQVHYLRMCEMHYKYRCPVHETSLID